VPSFNILSLSLQQGVDTRLIFGATVRVTVEEERSKNLEKVVGGVSVSVSD
jgi:hypothetical protein